MIAERKMTSAVTDKQIPLFKYQEREAHASCYNKNWYAHTMRVWKKCYSIHTISNASRL